MRMLCIDREQLNARCHEIGNDFQKIVGVTAQVNFWCSHPERHQRLFQDLHLRQQIDDRTLQSMFLSGFDNRFTAYRYFLITVNFRRLVAADPDVLVISDFRRLVGQDFHRLIVALIQNVSRCCACPVPRGIHFLVLVCGLLPSFQLSHLSHLHEH